MFPAAIKGVALIHDLLIPDAMFSENILDQKC